MPDILVSVIMPTKPTRQLSRPIHQYWEQDYPNKELIVISDRWAGRVLDDLDIVSKNTEWEAGPFSSIGAKRNYGCQMAKGEIIVMCDDDDYFASDYISKAVDHLIKSKADMTGLREAYFYRPYQVYEGHLGIKIQPAMWLYSYPAGSQPYVIGSGACFWKRVWERNKYPDISTGEDALFCANAGKISPHDYKEGAVFMIHGDNTASHKQIGKKEFTAIDPALAKSIMGKDYEKY